MVYPLVECSSPPIPKLHQSIGNLVLWASHMIYDFRPALWNSASADPLWGIPQGKIVD
jgi:hypothetical protein